MAGSINLTGVIIPDETVGGYTGYFAEIPEVIAEGNTMDELRENLLQALITVWDVKKEQYLENQDLGIQTEDFNLEVA